MSVRVFCDGCGEDRTGKFSRHLRIEWASDRPGGLELADLHFCDRCYFAAVARLAATVAEGFRVAQRHRWWWPWGRR